MNDRKKFGTTLLIFIFLNILISIPISNSQYEDSTYLRYYSEDFNLKFDENHTLDYNDEKNIFSKNENDIEYYLILSATFRNENSGLLITFHIFEKNTSYGKYGYTIGDYSVNNNLSSLQWGDNPIFTNIFFYNNSNSLNSNTLYYNGTEIKGQFNEAILNSKYNFNHSHYVQYKTQQNNFLLDDNSSINLNYDAETNYLVACKGRMISPLFQLMGIEFFNGTLLLETSNIDINISIRDKFALPIILFLIGFFAIGISIIHFHKLKKK